MPFFPLNPAALVAALIVWAAGAPLERGRDHHVVVEVATRGGPALLVAGGTDYREMLADAEMAAVEADGSVGAWRPAPPLPEARGGAVGAAVGEWVVVAGGQRADLTRVADVWAARVQGDGLGPWRVAPSLPAPRFHAAAAVAAGRIYVTGGQGPDRAEPSVYVADVTAEGPGEWRELEPLPAPRSHHASVVHGGALWLIGGLQGNPARSPTALFDVLRAEIEPDGGLGPWRSVSLMPHSYATHAAFAHEGALWVMGGVEDNRRFAATIWRAPVDSAGRVGAWAEVAPGLPGPRAHVHVTPVIEGRVYSVGGSASRQVRTQVDIGTLPSAPALVSAAGEEAGAREAVLGVVQGLFDAMAAKDTAGVRAAFEPGARLVGMRTRGSGERVVQTLSVDDFVAFVGRDPRRWTERAFDPEVRIDGSLATVWAAYDFHLDGVFSHCGTDAVHLLRTTEGWKITGLADTYEPDGCPVRPPLP